MLLRDLKRIESQNIRSWNKDRGDVVLTHAMPVKIKQGQGDDGRMLEIIGSTSNRDRHGDIIEQQGWKLGPWLAGGSFLWAHMPWDPPIAGAKSAVVNGEQLDFEVRFPEVGTFEFADLIRELYRQEILRGASVGFISDEWEMFKDEDGEGVRFTSQELLELSATPVPSNRESLAKDFTKAQEHGLDLSPMKRWASRSLGMYSRNEGSELWMPLKEIETLHEELSGVIEVKAAGGGTVECRCHKVTPSEHKTAIPWDASHPDGTSVEEDRDAEWDGPAQVAAAEVEDLIVMSTWVAAPEEGESVSKDDFRIIHHRADDKALVWLGLTSAMDALLSKSIDIPEEDRQEVYDHLAQHYRDDFGEEPPEFDASSDDDDEEASASMVLSAMRWLVDGTRDNGEEMTEGDKARLREAARLLGELVDTPEPKAAPVEGEEIEDIDTLRSVVEQAVGNRIKELTGELS